MSIYPNIIEETWLVRFQRLLGHVNSSSGIVYCKTISTTTTDQGQFLLYNFRHTYRPQVCTYRLQVLVFKKLNLASYAQIDLKFGRWFGNVSIFQEHQG